MSSDHSTQQRPDTCGRSMATETLRASSTCSSQPSNSRTLACSALLCATEQHAAALYSSSISSAAAVALAFFFLSAGASTGGALSCAHKGIMAEYGWCGCRSSHTVMPCGQVRLSLIRLHCCRTSANTHQRQAPASLRSLASCIGLVLLVDHLCQFLHQVTQPMSTVWPL